MGLLSRIAGLLPWVKRTADGDDQDDFEHTGSLWGVQSASGIRIDPRTALACTAVMAAVTILAEDVAKCTPQIYRRKNNGDREVAEDHFLYGLLTRPNDYMDGFEFLELGQAGLVFRSNAYAVILRDWRAKPVELIPVPSDWVAMWEAPTGELFYRITPNGLHMRAKLAGLPNLIPADDVLHIRGFSQTGLLGSSRISLARDAIGLALGQEQQAARWVGNGARPAGILKTANRLTDDSAKRMADQWKAAYGGFANSGRTPVFEQGLEWQPLGLSSQELEFIAARRFQIEEIARIFRVPPHLLGDLAEATNNNIESQGQDYVNFTISGYTDRWARKLEWHFDLPRQGLFIEFDTSRLTRADIAARYNAYRLGIMSGFLTRNEARQDDGRNKKDGADELLEPTNMETVGSQSAPGAAPGGGRPDAGTIPA